MQSGSNKSLERFKKYLGIPHASPSLELLQKIVPLHLEKIPFESLTKILAANPDQTSFPSLSDYVEAAVTYGLGGTCYANNAYFVELLRDLGFTAELEAARSNGGDVSHVSCKVHIDHQPYVFDFGNMTHFAGPLPLRPGEVLEDERGNNFFRFIPHEDGKTYRLEFHRDGQLIRDHENHPGAIEIEDIHESIQKTYAPTSYWLQIFCVCKHVGDATLGVWNQTFFHQQGRKVEKTRLKSIDDLKSVLTQEMDLPDVPVDQVLEKMRTYSGVEIF